MQIICDKLRWNFQKNQNEEKYNSSSNRPEKRTRGKIAVNIANNNLKKKLLRKHLATLENGKVMCNKYITKIIVLKPEVIKRENITKMTAKILPSTHILTRCFYPDSTSVIFKKGSAHKWWINPIFNQQDK